MDILWRGDGEIPSGLKSQGELGLVVVHERCVGYDEERLVCTQGGEDGAGA
jgi:hypothetical protein